MLSISKGKPSALGTILISEKRDKVITYHPPLDLDHMAMIQVLAIWVIVEVTRSLEHCCLS